MTLKWKILIGIGILLLAYGIVWGYRQYSFYKERSAIVEKQEEIQKELEKADLEHIQQEEALYRQLEEKKKLVSILDQRNTELENQIKNIIVPSNPDSLVDAWHKHGIRARRNLSSH